MNINQHSEKKFLANRVIIFIAVILAFFIVKARWIDGDGQRWRTIVETDGKGYYAYLPAIFLYHDLHYNFIVQAEASIYGIGSAQERELANGQPGNKYFVGEAVLVTPFFLLSWLISILTNHGSGGYNMIFFTSVAVAALFYLLVGLNFLKKLLRLFELREIPICIVLLLLVFTTNIFWYVVYEPSMSHIYSFAAVSAFLYYTKAFQLQRKSNLLVGAAIALAFVSLLRPVNAMIVLGIPFLMGSALEFRNLIRNIFANKKALFLSIICFSALAFIQPYLYYRTTGSFLRWPYSGEGFDFIHPHFWDGLFSYRKGLFLYTPIMFVSFLFILPYFKKSFFAPASYLLFFIVIIWVITSWSSWSYGGAFSLRPVLEFYPLLIIPLAVGLNGMKKQMRMLFLVFIFLPLTGFCMLETYQYENHILSYDEMNKEKYWKVFLKTDRSLRIVAYPPIADKISQDSLVSKKIIMYDFDHDAQNPFNTSEFFSGGHCLTLDKQMPFSPGYQSTYSDLKKDGISFVEISMMARKDNSKNDAALVVSFETPTGQIFKYNSFPVGLFLTDCNAWGKIEYSVKVPAISDPDVMKIYVWNSSEFPLLVDDLKIELFDVKR